MNLRFVSAVAFLLGAPAWAQCEPQWVYWGLAGSVGGTVNSLINWDSDGPGPQPPRLVAGGEMFSYLTPSSQSTSNVATWDGVTWTALGNDYDGSINAMAVLSNGVLISGGATDFFSSNPIRNVASWDGQAWKQMGDGLPGTVWALAALPDGEAVAAGHFFGAPFNCIARWNGNAWLPMGSGFDNNPSVLKVLPNGDLIAAGSFGRSGNVPLARIARWNGSAWTALGSGLNGSVQSACVDQAGNLIVSGNFTTAGGVPAKSVAMWNGQAWSAMGDGLLVGATALCMLPDGSIVATGAFGPAEGTSTNFLRRWDGIAWAPMAGGFNGPIRTMCVDAREDLVAGGYFSLANGRPWRELARWTEHPEPGIAATSAASRVHTGRAFRLTASPVNALFATYQWLHNGVPITEGLNGISPGGGSVSGATGKFQTLPINGGFVATLSIWAIQPSDAGDFTIAFTNTCGTTVSAPIHVEVTPHCLGDINNDDIVDDADFSLFCADYDIMYCLAREMPWGCPSAMNSDWYVDDADFVLFVEAYIAFACP
ncbi:MAG: hypothetical protein JNM86_09750 [Phycisphaerae bacterium]|nr:hypothetical protein [Phycisphaerae bacterium]